MGNWFFFFFFPWWSTELTAVICIAQRQRSRRGRSQWAWLDCWERECTTLESWWGLAVCIGVCWSVISVMLHDAFTAVPLQLMHPVLESLRNTDKQWLIDTLYAFNGGNVEKFQSYKSAWGQQVSHSVSVTSTWSIKGWTEKLWSQILSNEAKFY